MKIDIIIPNYNGSHLIEKNIKSVLDSIVSYDSSVIIVDDGSMPTDKEYLRNVITGLHDKRIQLHEHKKNKGFSSAVNTGVKMSLADFVVLLNSDVVPKRDFLKSPISKLSRDDKLFAVGCMDESIEGEKKIFRGRGVARWEKGMLLHSRGEVNRPDTFWVSGGSSVFRRSMYEDLGGMDEIYNPFYWEDIDLSYRAQKSGYTILFDRDSEVTHFHEKGAIMTNFTSSQVTTTAYRNQFVFIWKNISTSHLLVDHFLHLPIHVFGAFKRGDFNLVKGLFLAIALLPAIMNKRKKQGKSYKISDLEIIKKIS